MNAPSLLPSAFYDLSRYHLSDVFSQCHNASSPHSTLSLADTQRLALGKEAAHCAVTSLIRSLATEARSNPSHHMTSSLNHTFSGNHTSPHQPQPRGFAARHQHRRSDSLGGIAGSRCSSPAACWREVCELVDLATEHYLFDRERGSADPLYVAEELSMLKESGDGQLDSLSSAQSSINGGTRSGVRTSNLGLLDEDLTEAGTCRPCARAFQSWSVKERERLWRNIPGWFKLDQSF